MEVISEKYIHSVHTGGRTYGWLEASRRAAVVGGDHRFDIGWVLFRNLFCLFCLSLMLRGLPFLFCFLIILTSVLA